MRMWCAVNMLVVVACWLSLVFLYVNMWYVLFFFPLFFVFIIIGLLSLHSQFECALNRPDEHPSRLQRPVPGLP